MVDTQFEEEFKTMAKSSGYSDEDINTFLSQAKGMDELLGNNGGQAESTTQDISNFPGFSQEGMIPSAPITQKFGNRSSVEIYSGGINYGTDFGVPKGTAVATPPGKWKVLSAFGGATEGVRNTNQGYGNSVLVENMLTGERLRFSHLSQVGVNPGQEIEGGSVIAFSGNTGNSTGPHIDLEYYDQTGRIKDVLKSPYKAYL